MMRIRAEIGDPVTGEWGEPFYIDLVPYSEILAQQHPTLPPFPGIDDSLAIKDHKIDVHGQSTIEVTVNYHLVKNSVSIFVKFNGVSFLQIMGEAYSREGAGLSLLFQAPETSVPVNLTCEPEIA